MGYQGERVHSEINRVESSGGEAITSPGSTPEQQQEEKQQKGQESTTPASTSLSPC